MLFLGFRFWQNTRSLERKKKKKEKEIRIVDFERFRDIVKFRIWINLSIDCENSNKDRNI